MIFNIYLITVLTNLGVNLINFIKDLIMIKFCGYKWHKSAISKSLVISVISNFIIGAIIPILNAIDIIVQLCKFSKSFQYNVIYKDISILEDKGLIYNSCMADLENEKNNDDRNVMSKLVAKAKKNSDNIGLEMIESMYMEGASATEIKNELKNSKIERTEVIEENKTKKNCDFANNMVIETELNCELSLNEKKKLFELYKNALLSKKEDMTPIYESYIISDKNYQKTKH